MYVVEEETYHPPGPVRSLFLNGEWQVPEEQRPADWRQRMEPKPIIKPVKAPYLYVQMPQPARRGFQPGHPRYAGRPKGMKRVTISAQEVAARCNAEAKSVGQIAAELKCDPSLLYRRMQGDPAAVLAPRMCCDCSQPTGKAPQAKRCDGCAKRAQGKSVEEFKIRLAEGPAAYREVQA